MTDNALPKLIARLILAQAANGLSQRTIAVYFPKSRKLRLPEIIGGIAGWYAEEKFGSDADKLVDQLMTWWRNRKETAESK